ncbi:hypothetical protein KM043_000179 [Ampulex compressa]|nr:hypothetical protein KM043_000179 [Ampulex compressa]
MYRCRQRAYCTVLAARNTVNKICSRLLSCSAYVSKYGKRSYVLPVAGAPGGTSHVEYPPILDLSYEAKKNRKAEEWHDKIKGIKTIEEKLFELNMPRYYGWRSLLLEEGRVAYNSLSHAQYITRTHLMEKSDLPESYDSIVDSTELDSILQTIRNRIEDNVSFEYSQRRMDQRLTTSDITDPVAKTHAKANEMSYQVNRTLLTALSSKYPHLLEAQLDFEPRIEAFWFCGGINPPPCVVRAKESIRWLKPYAHKPVQIPVQYLGKPILQLRHNHPLKEIIPFDDLENRNLNVPEFKLDPRTLGYYFRRRHATNIPGFWPGDKAEFGVLSYHSSEYLEHRPKTFNDDFDALATQAILASYGNLLSQSCYQGFSTFHDVTYPLVSQMVITNGQWWTFCVYQLNTVLLHSEYVVNNPRSNICWMTKPMKLFEKVEEGKRMGVELKPYLGKKEKTKAQANTGDCTVAEDIYDR